MQKDDKVSKITKTIIKDLKGERIVYQNSNNGRIAIPEHEKDNAYIGKNKNYTWGLIWRLLVVIFIIDFSLFSYFKFYKKTGFIEGLNGWVISTRQFVYKNKKNDQIALIQKRKINYQPRKQQVYNSKRKPT